MEWKNLSLNEGSPGVALLVFDRPGSSANIFDEAALDELEAALDAVEKDRTIKTLIFTSAKPAIFIAGADIKALAGARDEEMDRFLERGQNLFTRIENLTAGTAAAIHGACMGGGVELALACDVRVASSGQRTKIGLPETLLGIIPAWGGSTRLPRLIGIKKSLSLILGAKKMAPQYAKKMGVVDDVVPKERLVERCLQLLSNPPPRKSFALENSRPAAALAKWLALRGLKKRTRGNYPAPVEAVEVVTAAPRRDLETSLSAERSAVLRLANDPVAGQLTRLFFLSEKSKKTNAGSAGQVPEVRRCAVIGAGVMGAGIAHWTASRRLPVLLKDIDEDAVARGMRTIRKRFREGVNRKIFSKGEAAGLEALISPAAEAVPMKRCDLVIEAAVENMEIKKKIFEDLVSRTRPDTILSTNTSALSVTELASGIENPERVAGLHFFNPVHRMKLVEVIRPELASPETIDACLNFVRTIGKSPVLVKDSPGFLVNRILMPYLIEAGRLIETGVDPAALDRAMLDFGMPVGPARLLDDIGLDVALHVAETMASSFPGRMNVPSILSELVEAGSLGRKSGRGIYEHGQGNKERKNPEMESLTEGVQRDMDQNEITDRLSLLMCAESFRCLEEEIVDSPDDIDFAMILGTGWAPFRGGPVTYAETIGTSAVADRLAEFDREDSSVYSVPQSLES